MAKARNIDTVIVCGEKAVAGAHIVVDTDGSAKNIADPAPSRTSLCIAVLGKELTKEASEKLLAILRNCISGMPVTSIVEGPTCCFDLPQWLRDHKKVL